MRSRISFLCALIFLVFLAVPGLAAEIDQALSALRQGDFRGAADKLQPLAAAGDPVAQYELGVMFGNGDGVPQDLGQALKWLRLAAQAGHAKAKESLSFMEIADQGGAGANPGGAGDGAAPPEPDDAALTTPALIQIATVKNEAIAMAEWRRQQRRFTEQLGQLNPVVQPFDAGARGTLFRVMGGPVELEQARESCNTMKRAGGMCMIVRPSAPPPPAE